MAQSREHRTFDCHPSIAESIKTMRDEDKSISTPHGIGGAALASGKRSA
jgi:hypothetical protein